MRITKRVPRIRQPELCAANRGLQYLRQHEVPHRRQV